MENDRPKGEVRVISMVGTMKAFEEGTIPEVLTNYTPRECDAGRDEGGSYCWFINGEWRRVISNYE